MERVGKIQRGSTKQLGEQSEVVLQWGKRLRCVRIKNPNFSGSSSSGFRRKITSRIVSDSDPHHPQSIRFNRVIDLATSTAAGSAGREKEERYYTTRGSVGDGVGGGNEKGKFGGGGDGEVGSGGGGEENGGVVGRMVVWPKLLTTLSSKEKDEDFMAMKGCRLPPRPKKRAKSIQRTLLLVSPGAWLSDMCLERYEVREKKASKKRPRGLKARGSFMDSDSD